MLNIINYHYTRENFKTPYPSIFGVTPTDFKKQLVLLKNEGNCVSPSEFVDNFTDIVTSKEKCFFITFDDGLKEQYELALPIIDELGMQAVFFANSINFEEKKVSTVHKIHLLRSILLPDVFLSYLDQHQIKVLTDVETQKAITNYRFDDIKSASLKYLLNFKIPFDVQEVIVNSIFERYFSESEVLETLYMDISQIKHLANLNCLGSHTHSHYPLGLLNKNKLNFELEHSKHYFEKLTEKSIQMVTYPYGTDEACTSLVAETAEKVGYLFGFTTKKGEVNVDQNKLLLKRFDCNDVIGGKNYKK